MNKDILIIGPSHCGKTAITNEILRKYNFYEPMRGDSLLISLNEILSQYLRKEKSNYFITEPQLYDKQIVKYLHTLYEQLKIDLYNTNRNIIIDTYTLDLNKVLNVFGDSCDIYVLGMPDESVKALMKKISKEALPNDWLSMVSEKSLERFCEEIIASSKKIKSECGKHKIHFFDMSGNRDEKIKKVISEIENKSIS